MTGRTRNVFDATHAVGALAERKPVHPVLLCVAHGCPMPGVIFLGGGEGVCGWHYGRPAHDWPRITQVIADWSCVTRQINAVRRVLSDPTQATDPRALQAVIDHGARLADQAPGWRLEPDPREDIGQWARRLEAFLQGCVDGKAQRIEYRDPPQLPADIPPRRKWAYLILARHARGDHIDGLPLKMAREVLERYQASVPDCAPTDPEDYLPC